MIGLEVDPKLANKKNKRARALLYEKDKDTICGKDLNKRQKMNANVTPD